MSKLHQDLADQQASAEPPSETTAEAPAVDLELVGESATPNLIATAPEEQSNATIDISPEPSEPRPDPRSAHELFEIPWKTFAPPKPSLAVESKALVNIAPEMPRLKALPLRPKVAKTPPGFSPQSSAAPATGTTPPSAPPAEPKSKTPAPAAPRPETRSSQIPAPSAKPPAAPVKSPPTVQTVKPGQTSKPAQQGKPAPAAKPAQPAKPQQPAVRTAKATGTDAPLTSKQPAPAPPGAREKTPAQPVPSPAAKEQEQAEKPVEEAMPSFASIQTGKNLSFIGSLKGKLTIAILLVLTAGILFYSLSSKAHSSAPAPASTSEDGVGPSIMLGEGGWVQGWAGDPNGSNAGRQITIYRPSLKLTDYRIEFQGEIDTKSIGWVFRALDPYNYYAMKLAIVTPGLSPKLALIKYLVVQGHEKEWDEFLSIWPPGMTPFLTCAWMCAVPSSAPTCRGSRLMCGRMNKSSRVASASLNERAERARIKSVAISYLTGGKN